MYKKFIKKIIYMLLILLIFCSVIYLISYSFETYSTKKQSNLLNELPINEDTTLQNSDESLDLEIKSEKILRVEELQKENSDIVGWIEIENTNINYPVLQSSDNYFYLKRDYKKNYSINGSIFLDKDCYLNPQSCNLLIYGHNNRNNTMFQDLLKYEDFNFYKTHSTINFTTNAEDSKYEIIAVFKSKVYNKSDTNVFRYYYSANIENQKEYNEFVQNSKKSSIYDTNKTAEYGEPLMTLSTCSYHTTDGRFVVVAKKIIT